MALFLRVFLGMTLILAAHISIQSASAHSFLRTAADADHDWNNPANWSSGVVPDLPNTGDGAFENGMAIGVPNIFAGSVDDGHATISSAVPEVANTIYVGVNGGDGTLEILPGGSLTNFVTMVVGEAACCGNGTGIILMSGGDLLVNSWVQFANRASLGATARSNWIQTGGTATFSWMNGWAGDHPANLGSGFANFRIRGGSLELPNGVGPHENVSIVLSDTGQYIVWDDFSDDPTLGGIASAAPGWELVANYDSDDDKTTLSANFLFLVGDFDGDDDVDDMDYGVWRTTFGSSVEPFTGADGNGDGVINAADYVAWHNNVGAVPPSAAASAATNVPEPATLSLLLAASLGFCRVRPSGATVVSALRIN